MWKRNGPDHYVHALGYALVGLQRFGNDGAKIVGDDSFAGIPKGQIVQPESVATFIRGEDAQL